MDWDAFWLGIRPDFYRIANEVCSSVPSLEVSISRGPGTHVAPFLANVEFGFPSRCNATPWGVDLTIQVACGLVGRMGLRNPGGTLYQAPPNATGRYALKCELQRGDGDLISALPPMIMPADPQSDDFTREAEAFTLACIDFCTEQIPVMVKSLTMFDGAAG
jgi:hypothetical protein